MKKFPFIAFLTFVVIILSQGCKPEIAQWRGINRDGQYNELNLLDEWPADGPELLWVYEGIGNGYAAPTVTKDRIFVNGEVDSISFLLALDLNGELLWKKPNGKAFLGKGYSSKYPGARTSPTVIGNWVYACSGRGRIACFKATSGDEYWTVDMVNDLGGIENMFGFSESLAVDNKKVYCNPGGPETNLAALNRKTGEIIWTSEAFKDTTAYCSPILVDLPDRKVLITTSRYHLFAIDCENGELLGSYKLQGVQWDGEHCNSPIYSEGNIFYIPNDRKGKGAVKLELSDDGTKITEIWNNENIRNNFGGFVLSNNQLLTTIKGNWLKSIEISKGIVTDSLKVAAGSIISADNKLICYGMNGEVNLITQNQNKLKVAGSFKIEKGSNQHFSHPVVAHGILYVRHGNALMAYKIN